MKRVVLIVPGLLLLGMAKGTPQDSPGAAVQASSSCARCHSNSPDASALRDAENRPIAPFDLWQSTMMANSARDPLWRAVVSAEVAATPSRRTEIESTCLKCHAPMAAAVGLEEHSTGSLMHVLDCESDLGELARDGVSCTICHGMSPDGLGSEASFSAEYTLDPERRLFGPHAEPLPMPMRMMTGFTPTEGAHVAESSMCGSCHTLETDTLDPAGKLTGHRLLEQAPYLEWLNSDFRDEGPEPGPRAASCQDCHVPTYDQDGKTTTTRIARNPMGGDFAGVKHRNPYGRHLLVGGNTMVLAMLKEHAEELGVTAPPAALQATLEATREQLQEHSVRLSIGQVQQVSNRLSFQVDVANLTGHKFPTAHPTRRAWLRVIVRDSAGKVLFASGATDERGQILDAQGKPLASELAGGPVDPHVDLVRSANDVASYHALMADAEGQPTHTLMRGASWMRDDRLLPKGWSADYPGASRTAPQGIGTDENFKPGADRVQFEIDLKHNGPVTIEAAMLYQTLSARWAAELMRWDTPEIERFRRFYARAGSTPEVLSPQSWPR